MTTPRRREVLLGLAGAAATPCGPSKRAHNVILVLLDDLGWAELGCYGNRFNRTLNLDRMAARGMRFTDGYAAAPVCSPTRAAIMTGQHPARVGITDYLRADDTKFLPPADTTLPRILATAGYVSVLIGKWHLMGHYDRRPGDPKLHGFTEVICSETRYIGPGDYFYPYDFMPEVKLRKEPEYLTDRLNQEAVEFIERNKDRPFFLYLSHYAVHTRLAGKQELVEKYKRVPEAGQTRNNPELAAMLESVDEGIGMVQSALRKLGLEDGTTVIFTSDNGGEDRVTSNAPLRAGKSQLYEGGIRVPLIVSGPAVGRPGSVCRAPVSSTDLYPTILELAGVPPLRDHLLDGRSITGLLKNPELRRIDPIYWHYPLDKPHFLGGRSSGAIRRGSFKLIEFFDTGTVELYDLAQDTGETSDLSAKKAQKTRELRRMLVEWRSRLTRTLSLGRITVRST